MFSAAVTTFRAGDTRRAWWITAATATYTLGVFGVTGAGNVPLNDALDAFTSEEEQAEGLTAELADEPVLS